MLSRLLSSPSSQDRKAFAAVVEGSITDRIQALGASVAEVRELGRSFLAITFDQAPWRDEAGQKLARERIADFQRKAMPLLRSAGYRIDGTSTGFNREWTSYGHYISASTVGENTEFEKHMISTIGGND